MRRLPISVRKNYPIFIRPRLSMVLLLAMALAGAGLGFSCSQKKQATSAPQTVEIRILAYSTDSDGKAQGSTHTCRITVAPKTDPGIRVSFGESEVGGQGENIRAAGWTAATMACFLLGVNPDRIEFRYDISGWVDGPSAGAMTTIGTIAAILGDPIPKDVAMTGTINPDGSVGPVGGIPHKIDGAAKAGIKKMLIPGGQRMDTDENTKSSVDLVERGREKGIDVQLVSNIFDAYQMITGRPLPQPQGTYKHNLPSPVYNKMKAAVLKWLDEVSREQERYQGLSDQVKEKYDEDYKNVEPIINETKGAIDQGRMPVALSLASAAASSMGSIDKGTTIFQAGLDRGIEAAEAEAKSTDATLKEAQVRQRLRSQEARSPAAAVGLMDSYSYYADALYSYYEGKDLLDQMTPENLAKLSIEQRLGLALGAAQDNASASIGFDAALVYLDLFCSADTQGPAPDLRALAGMAELMRRAGSANVAAFDSTILFDVAQAKNLRNEVAQSNFASNESLYGRSRFILNSMHMISSQGESAGVALKPEDVYFSLGAGQDAYGLSTALLSKYYSLDAVLDENLNIQGYGRDKALSDMLRLAEQRSERLMSICKDPPLPSLCYHENAVAQREGSDAAKLDALFSFWQSAILSQVFSTLTGEYGTLVWKDLEASGRTPVLPQEYWFRTAGATPNSSGLGSMNRTVLIGVIAGLVILVGLVVVLTTRGRKAAPSIVPMYAPAPPPPPPPIAAPSAPPTYAPPPPPPMPRPMVTPPAPPAPPAYAPPPPPQPVARPVAPPPPTPPAPSSVPPAAQPAPYEEVTPGPTVVLSRSKSAGAQQKLGTLVCVRGVIVGQRFDIPPAGLTVGRAEGNGVVVRDGRVSGNHAWIGLQEGKLVVVDKGSTNGTYVTEVARGRVANADLKNGQLLIFGDPEACTLQVQIP